jgi:tetratricopeptide (TPR) repeat protein
MENNNEHSFTQQENNEHPHNENNNEHTHIENIEQSSTQENNEQKNNEEENNGIDGTFLLQQAQQFKDEGNKHFLAQQYEEAIELYTKSISLLKTHNKEKDYAVEYSIYHSNRAACYLNQKKYEETVKDCDVCLEVNPGYMKALLRRANALENVKQLQKALDGV